MTNGSLVEGYLVTATKRLKILPVLLEERAQRALDDAVWVVSVAAGVIGRNQPGGDSFAVALSTEAAPRAWARDRS